MTTYDLMLKIKEALEAEGFEVSSAKFSNLLDFEFQATATKDGKSWWTPVEGYTFTNRNGFTIFFQVVHRHNGTEENKSVDLSIYEWKNSLGHRITKERLNVNQSEKQIQNRIKKIVDKYNEIEVVR